MKNTLADLNNYLFESLERINDDELDSEQLDKEIQRTETTVKVSEAIIKNAGLILNAIKHADEYGYKGGEKAVNKLLEGE